MAPVGAGAVAPQKICSICRKVLWFELQPEDLLGTPHHSSREALEASAKSCRLCHMILRAAVANYRDSRGRRNGKGYWREFVAAKHHSGSGVRDVTFVKDLGANMPVNTTGHSKGGAKPILAHTGNITADGTHIDDDEPSLDEPTIDEDETADLPVWLYGNWWSESEPKESNSTSQMRLMGVGARFGKTQSHFDAFNCKPDWIHVRGSQLGICASDDSSSSTHIPGRLRELNSDSAMAFHRLQKWLKDCTTNHHCCERPQLKTKLPTRVIDVFSSDRKVSVFETSGHRGKYVTLSHCWGTSSRLTATKESIADLKDGIAISFLPKTFQDAIRVTRRLGIEYLWIDCLCIIQDDPDDWERETSAMNQIYRNSYLTISAAASDDSYTGCFPKRETDSYVSPASKSLGYNIPREPRGPRSFTLDCDSMSRPGKKNKLHLFEEWLPGSSFDSPQRMGVGTFGKRLDPIADEPLSSRAWTLQERLLSPRIVHYARDQMYFECETCLKSEDGFKFDDIYFGMSRLLETQRIPYSQHGLPPSFGGSPIIGQHSGATNPGVRWQGGWLSLIENYTRRNMTVSKDKLTAIAGVARALGEETQDRYYAGLWGRHFMEDLFWRTYPQEEMESRRGTKSTLKMGKMLGAVRRPAEYRAPSWSWASLDGPIKYIPLSYNRLVAEILMCTTIPAGKDLYGRCSGGKLDIRGPIYEVKPHRPKTRWDRHGIPVEIDFADERGISVGALHLDFADEPISYPCYAFFIDPSKALIVRARELEPRRNEDGTDDPTAMVPRAILTSTMAKDLVAENPEMESLSFQALDDVGRVGVAVFVRASSGKKGAEEREREQRSSTLGDECAGLVRDDEFKILVSIV